MPSENQSPSYLETREKTRRFLLETEDGQEALRVLKEHASPQQMARIFDDDKLTAWEDMIEEFRGSTVLVRSCREAQAAFELAAGATNHRLPAPKGHARMRKIATIPSWYMLRRTIELCDPDYWNRPANMYRELLDNPQWSCVPARYIRGQLEQHLPKGKQVVLDT